MHLCGNYFVSARTSVIALVLKTGVTKLSNILNSTVVSAVRIHISDASA